MKVALIGVGKWGQVLSKELKNLAGVKYECNSQFDLNIVFNDPEIEAVFIATPTQTHLDIAKRALESGKHVFLEKPGTTTSIDLQSLVELAKDRNLKFAIGYEFPHHPAFAKLRELMANQAIKTIRFDWLKWGTFKDSAVIHLLCHDISIMLNLGLTNLQVSSHKARPVISPTDIIWTEFKNDQNVYVESFINRVSPIKQKTVTVITENGGYVWSNSELSEIDPATQELKKIEIEATTPVSLELVDFLAAIKENREPKSNGEFAVQIFQVIEQVK